ncbi:hypothetical protein HYV73_02480 [Candidatus Uhrbacteria bacterium]|nr:hypothetical protein [Candidatus Uhrbacteria bacterium]
MALPSLGRVLDESWGQYRQRFFDHLNLTWPFLLLSAITIATYIFYPQASSLLDPGALYTVQEKASVVVSLVLGISTSLTILVIYGALIVSYDGQLNNRPVSNRKAFALGWKKLPMLLLLTVLLNAIMFLARYLPLVPSLVLAVIGTVFPSLNGLTPLIYIFEFIGRLAAVFIVLAVAIDYFFSLFTFMLEGKKGWSAFLHSREIVKGLRFAVFGRLVIPSLIFFFGAAAVGVLLLLSANMINVSITGYNADLYARLKLISTHAVTSVLFALVFPALVAIQSVVYQHLKDQRRLP